MRKEQLASEKSLFGLDFKCNKYHFRCHSKAGRGVSRAQTAAYIHAFSAVADESVVVFSADGRIDNTAEKRYVQLTAVRMPCQYQIRIIILRLKLRRSVSQHQIEHIFFCQLTETLRIKLFVRVEVIIQSDQIEALAVGKFDNYILILQ